MRVLVTGGAGFVGSHVVDGLVGAGHQVRVMDVLHPAVHAVTPEYLNPRAELIRADATDQDAVTACVGDVDAVSHQAAMVGLGAGFDDVVEFVRHNDLGTAILLRALARSGFRGRLVVASSMVVYGEGRYRCPVDGPVTPGPRGVERLAAGLFDPPCPRCGRDLLPEPVAEGSPIDPRTVYAATKVHQEHLAWAFGRELGLPVTALRYHNVYGPRMPRDTPYAGVAAIFRSALEGGRPPQVFEDGRQLRDFVHVRDVARANLLAMEAEPAPAGAFNVASGEPHTVGEMAAALSRAFGPDAPRPDVTGRHRPGDVRHVFASTVRAEEVLAFRAQVGFEPGMAEFATAPLRAPAGIAIPAG